MRRDQQRLTDIPEALDWISKATSRKTEAEFVTDETLCYAVAQKLTIIGEAVARLSPELKARRQSMPWRDIVGLRNILVHEYFGIWWPVVWQTAADHTPILRAQIPRHPGGLVHRLILETAPRARQRWDRRFRLFHLF